MALIKGKSDMEIIIIWSLIGLFVAVVGMSITFRFISKLEIAKKDVLNSNQDVKELEPPPAPSETSPTVEEQIKERVLKKEFEKKENIGGIRLLTKTLPDASEKEVAVVFKQVEDKKALVNLALAGSVRIEEVLLKNRTLSKNNREFYVLMKVRNLTDKDLEIKIPEGQLFENKADYANRQNLAAVKEDKIMIPAFSEKAAPIKIEAFCANKGFDAPNNPGNITIFELERKQFVTQDQVWDWLEDKIHGSDSKRLLSK